MKMPNGLEVILPGEIYLHAKSDRIPYEIISSTAIDTTTGNRGFIVYRALRSNPEKGTYSGQVFIRPLEEFLGTVDIGGIEKPRFTLLARNFLEASILLNCPDRRR